MSMRPWLHLYLFARPVAYVAQCFSTKKAILNTFLCLLFSDFPFFYLSLYELTRTISERLSQWLLERQERRYITVSLLKLLTPYKSDLIGTTGTWEHYQRHTKKAYILWTSDSFAKSKRRYASSCKVGWNDRKVGGTAVSNKTVSFSHESGTIMTGISQN